MHTRTTLSPMQARRRAHTPSAPSTLPPRSRRQAVRDVHRRHAPSLSSCPRVHHVREARPASTTQPVVFRFHNYTPLQASCSVCNFIPIYLVDLGTHMAAPLRFDKPLIPASVRRYIILGVLSPPPLPRPIATRSALLRPCMFSRRHVRSHSTPYTRMFFGGRPKGKRLSIAHSP